MAMAFAVAFTACQAAAPAKPGEPGAPGEPGQPGEPAPRLPYLKTGFANVELAATGEMATMSITLAGHFVDPHEGELTYSASSEPSDVVKTSVSGSTLTLTALKEGTATVTVEAENQDGASSFNPGAQFTVTVMETVAPMVAEGGIPDQTLYKDDGPVTLTLTKADADSMGYFTHESDITYVVSSSPVGFVKEVEAEGVLTLTPLVTGQTIVTVVATADSRSTDPVTFTVDVMAGSKPVAPMSEGMIEAKTLMVGGDSVTFDVESNFSDSDSDALTYSASSSDDTVATAMADGSMVTVTAVAAGTATITVTATDEGDRTATQMVDVTVTAAPEPPEPPEPPQPPEPVNVAPVASTITPQTMTVGDAPATLDVSPFFSDADGDTLTFSNPVSSDPMVATVTLSGSTLTITAVMAGTSNLSVTATDPDGLSATGTAALTVSEPESSIPSSLELSVGGVVAPTTHELVLPDGYTLQSADSSKVNVVRTGATGEGNQWRLTARAKTTKPPSVTVYVNDEQNTEHTTIEVTVLNSPPVRNKTNPSLALLDLSMVNIITDQTQASTYPDGLLYDPQITDRVLYRTGSASDGNGLGDLNRFYTDADGDPLSFSIEVAAPHVGLILFKQDSKGFSFTVTNTSSAEVATTPTVHVVYADILTERIDRPIGINIYANDGEATSEKSAYFELRNEKPIPRDETQATPAGNRAYLLTQLQEPGFFRDENYGNRTGVDHIFKFGHATKMADLSGTSTRVLGFTFAHDFLEKLEEDGFTITSTTGHTLDANDHLYSVGADTDATSGVTYGKPDTDPADDALGTIYYEAEISGPITQKDQLVIDNFVSGSAETANTAVTLTADTHPEMKFRFNTVGTGSVHITFGVWADEDGAGSKAPGWQTETRQIDFTIIGCTSVETIADCP